MGVSFCPVPCDFAISAVVRGLLRQEDGLMGGPLCPPMHKYCKCTTHSALYYYRGCAIVSTNASFFATSNTPTPSFPSFVPSLHISSIASPGKLKSGLTYRLPTIFFTRWN